MTTTEDKPVDRDAWRRLLDGGNEGPQELTDARIRAKARQALSPRTKRWWLPASLAASLLLAVVLVQRQYERPLAPAVVSESDYAVAPAEAPAAAQPEELRRDEALQRQDSRTPDAVAAAAPERAAPRESSDLKEDLRNFTPDPPVVPPPQIDLPATSDSRALSGVIATGPAADATPAPAAPAPAASAPAQPAAEAKREDEGLGEIVVSGSRSREGSLESTTPVTQVTSADVAGRSAANAGGLMKSGEAERTPEEWYAEIEKLRAAGKKRAAKRELEKLKAAHPGWLEENHPTDR